MDELPENLEPDQIPGGQAVKPGRLSQAVGGAKDKLAKKAGEVAGKKLAGKAAGEAAADAATAGTGGLGAVLRPIIKKATELVVKKLLSKDWWKFVLKAFWPQILAWAMIVLFIVIAIALVSRATRGLMGRSRIQAASIYDSSVMGSIDVILGDQIMVSNTPQLNYFSQGDPNFNKQPLNGHWTNNEPYLKNAGCGITSCAMMIRYYGVTNVDPVKFANDMANGGSLALIPEHMSTYLPNKKVIKISPRTIETVSKFIQNGDPVLAHGDPICGSSGEHYVLIVGISKDMQNFVISDPAASKPRQSAARSCSKNSLLGNIKELIVLQDK